MHSPPSPPQAVIGPATLDQIPAMAALFEAQLREHGIDSTVDGLVGVLRIVAEQPQHGFVLSAVCDGVLVGVAYAACILSLEHSGWAGWLE